MVADTSGSSPRARGAVNGGPFRCNTPRFIPTCAGSRQAAFVSMTPNTVHPRVHGEQRLLPPMSITHHGSSPRARGTGDGVGIAPVVGRFIPAYAGSGHRPCSAPCSPSVHPHRCGERAPCGNRTRLSAGSSPRARGAAGREHSGGPWQRFIPTCAGSSDALGQGEPERRGSSPRARGAAFSQALSECLKSFIPACAGSRRMQRTTASRRPVHPHVLGEQGPVVHISRQQSGSSPRARGAVQYLVQECRCQRFIPACAGSRHQLQL